MSRFTSEGLSYPDAQKLIAQLRQESIEATITAGGVAIYPEPEQVTFAERICNAMGASFRGGFSTHQEDILLRSRDGYETCERVTNDALAVQQEWNEDWLHG